jgi:hypothetical protein
MAFPSIAAAGEGPNEQHSSFLVRSNAWEGDMFAGAYASSPAVDKVKYGALNVTCDYAGVASARGYGDSFLILSRGVRLRATFALLDSSSDVSRACMGTCEHYAHVLAAYADADLLTALEVGSGRRAGGAASAAAATYKEAQVHGPIELARHVEALVGATYRAR